MSITVEFFGVPRLRAGIASVTLEAGTVKEALLKSSQLLPDWADHCLEEGNLKPEYLMNINGIHFCKDENEKMESGDSLLIFSADVGG